VCRVWGVGFRVYEVGFRVQGRGVREEGDRPVMVVSEKSALDDEEKSTLERNVTVITWFRLQASGFMGWRCSVGRS
jgi:hypothetical protein